MEGDYHTWSNKQLGSDRVCSRLDRALRHDEWMHIYGHLVVEYRLPYISNHSLMHLDIRLAGGNINTPFRFFNVWASHESFIPG